jgi:hypothetical protein
MDVRSNNTERLASANCAFAWTANRHTDLVWSGALRFLWGGHELFVWETYLYWTKYGSKVQYIFRYAMCTGAHTVSTRIMCALAFWLLLTVPKSFADVVFHFNISKKKYEPMFDATVSFVYQKLDSVVSNRGPWRHVYRGAGLNLVWRLPFLPYLRMISFRAFLLSTARTSWVG